MSLVLLQKNCHLARLGNSLAGILGGGIGGQLLGMLGMGGGEAAGAMDLNSILTNVAAGGAGGVCVDGHYRHG